MRLRTFLYLALLAISSATQSGCQSDDQPAPSQETATAVGDVNQEQLAEKSRVDTVQLTSRRYVATIDLPGASVHGFETTLLEAKVGGYVKELGKVKDVYTGELVEVDIGALVEKGQLLAVLDAPEVLDELNEKKAQVVQAKSVVVQAEAMILQAEAEVASANAMVDQMRTELQEKQALRELSQAEYENQRKLYDLQATTRELVAKASAKRDAATAMLQTVDARIRSAEAGVSAALANLRKSRADLNSAHAQVLVAQAAESGAKTWVQYARITAPFAGTVSKRMVDHGAFVRPATSNSSSMPLFEIVRSDKVRIEASVPMSRAERIRAGQPVVFHTIGGLPGVSVEGTLTRASLVLDQETRTLEIHVDLTNPVTHAHLGKLDGEWTPADRPLAPPQVGQKQQSDKPQQIHLKPGMFGTLTILETWDDLAIAPTSAVATDESGSPYVFVVVREEGSSRCRRRHVQVIFNDAKEVGLRGGIQAGETVVARNIDQLSDGQPVEVAGAS